MKNITFFILILFVLSSVKALSQDIIILNSKERIEGKVVEVGLQSIKYKKATNLNGPLYSSEKKEVFLIIYANGTQESFDKASSNSSSSIPSPSKPTTTEEAKTTIVPPSAPIIISSSPNNSTPQQVVDPPITGKTEQSSPQLSSPKRVNLEDMLIPTGRYKLSSSNKEKMRKNDSDIYRQYKSGRTMKTVFGSISLVSSGIFVLFLVNDLVNFDVNNTSAIVISPATYIFAGTGLVTSFLTKGPKKRIKRSYTNHNNDIKKQMERQTSLELRPSKNGIGLAMSF